MNDQPNPLAQQLGHDTVADTTAAYAPIDPPPADRVKAIADVIGPVMLLGLQDAELVDEPGRERIRDWVKWISETIAALPPAEPASEPAPEPERGELWSLLEWTFWGSGMGDVFREPLADTMLAAISPEQRAQAEQLMEAWHASGREPLGRRRYEELSAELKKAREDLAEEKASHDPRLRCLLVKAAPDKDMYIGWSNVCEMPAGVWSRETAIEYGFPPSRLDRADKNGSSDMSCGDGHWADPGFVAEQRGWLRRDRLGDYAVEYLHGDRQAAFNLLEPFEGETEVRR